VGALADGPGGI